MYCVGKSTIFQVKKFLADFKRQEDRKILDAKSRKKKKDYDKEMQGRVTRS